MGEVSATRCLGVVAMKGHGDGCHERRLPVRRVLVSGREVPISRAGGDGYDLRGFGAKRAGITQRSDPVVYGIEGLCRLNISLK